MKAKYTSYAIKYPISVMKYWKKQASSTVNYYKVVAIIRSRRLLMQEKQFFQISNLLNFTDASLGEVYNFG